MYNNNLTRGYQQYTTQPIQFMNNQLLNNNPLYASNIYDQNFYHQMMLQKEDQMKKIRTKDDLKLNDQQITEYVIAPIRVEKSDSREIDKLIDDQRMKVTQKYLEENWWKERTNAPYKNILVNEDWKKDFKKKEDLIVHKVSDLDKVGLIDDYKKILKLIEEQNGQLKVIFSASKKNEHKQAFKYVQKYRDRVSYNPKDFNDLKDYYKKEQNKYEREQKKIDDVIARLMDEDDIGEDAIKRIESEFLKPTRSKKNKQNENSYEKNIDRQIQELIDEYGEDVVAKMAESSDEESPENHQTEPPKTAKVKIVKKNITNTNNTKPDEQNDEPKRIRIKRPDDIEIKTTEQSDTKNMMSDKRIRIKKISTDSGLTGHLMTKEKSKSKDKNIRRIRITKKDV
jgi:hypothetical protein